ncbi:MULTISPECIES: DUF6541 family protein [Actinomyces]|uniref:Tat pathway signal sequence n=1 Tax=Actinomyces respiraculi TaxID=2744574 RepID=A0A7T0PXG0_9ACTO|nr:MULTISPECIES: DUF6541 family protein [Actinomyces]QPL05810.1 hypothetical protein ID810_02220 [Actinomyces respiraculi]
MSSWISALPILAALAVVTFGPGLLILLAAGARSRLAALACAPSLTFALLGSAGVIFEAVGVRWHLPTVIAWMLAWALLVVAGRWSILALRGRRLTLHTWTRVPLDPSGVPEGWSGGGAPGEPTGSVPALAGPRWLPATALLTTWLAMLAPVLPGSGPTVPIQSADSIYHYNQAWLIELTGNASMLNGNAGMFGMDGTSSFYPMVWHEIATLVSLGWDDVVPVTNTMILLVPLVYLVGVLYLVRVVLEEIRGAAWVALGACAFIPIFPMRLLMDTAVWPYALALAGCPAVAAWAVAQVRRCRWLWTRRRRLRAATSVLAIVPAAGGLLLTHPAALVIIGWPLAALAWTGLLLAAWRLSRSEDRHDRLLAAALVAVAVAVVLVVVAVVTLPGPLQTHFGRRPTRTWTHAWKKVVSALVLFYGGGGWTMRATQVAMGAACLAGAAVAMVRHRHRGVVVAWVACLPLIVSAMAPVPVLSALTGVFYNNPHRIKAMTAAPAVLLVTLALTSLAPVVDRVRRRGLRLRSDMLVPWRLAGPVQRFTETLPLPARAGAVLLLAGTLATAPALRHDVVGAFSPYNGHQRLVASPHELDMMRRLALLLPDDAYVVGDPVAGTAMLPFMADVRPVWMFAGQAESDADGLYLRAHLRDLHEDPHVCGILREHGIRYFYEDSSQFFNGVWLATLRPGLYDVDTSTGFRLLDAGGTARVWEITLCDTGA